MNKKKVLEEFYDQVEKFVTVHNFKLNKSQSIAKRKTEFGFDSLFFDVNDMIDNYSITTALRIRHNEIQEIKGEVNPRYRNRKETSTVLEMVSSLLERHHRLDIYYEIENPGNLVNEKTLESYLVAFKRFMNEVGFSFFNSFKTIEDFDNWFNSPLLDGTYNFSRGLNWNNSVSGLIAAKLSKNPRYQEIYDKWVSGISSMDTETLTELEATKKYLDALTSN
jgi:hypothetical protein